MNKLMEYCRLVLFVFGVLVGIQLPSFVGQYGQSLQARLLESNSSVAVFQDDADRYFGGDMNKLIDHYAKKKDPVINSGGESISALMSRNRYLEVALRDFNQSIYSQYLHVFVRPIIEVRDNVWQHYSFSVVLNMTAILFGLAAGLLGSIVLDLFFVIVGFIFKGIFVRKKSPE